MAKPLQPKSEPRSRASSRRRLADAGFRSEAAGSVFLGLKFVGLIVGLLLGGGTTLLTSQLHADRP